MNLQTLQLALSPAIITALADDDGDGIADDAVNMAILQSAENEIRAALANTVTLEPDSLPAQLQDIVITLAIERLYERRREVPPNVWRERANRARAILREMRNGNHPVDGALSTPRAVRSTHTPEQRAMNDENLNRL